MKQKQADIEQFSRWFRMLVITAISKNKQSAVQYFVQVLDILNQEYVKVLKIDNSDNLLIDLLF